MATMYYERDCNLALLDGKKIAVIEDGSISVTTTGAGYTILKLSNPIAE